MDDDERTGDSDFGFAPFTDIHREIPFAGRVIDDRYELVEVIARGGFGITFKAIDLHCQERPVALKVIQSMPEDDARRFEEIEIPVLRRCGEHRNVVGFLAAGRDACGSYVVMDYVEGERLDRVLGHYRSVRELLRIFRGICDAVQHVHNNMVVHRDLKPANILVDEEGKPVLVDFGAAAIRATPETGLRRGPATPLFAAPEQLDGSAGATTWLDTYGLGELLFYMLTGSAAYHKEADASAQDPSILVKAKSDPGVPTPNFSRSLTFLRRKGDLRAILEKAMSPSPSARYKTPLQLAEDTVRYERAKPIVARNLSAGQRLMRLAERSWRPVAVCIALGVFLPFAVSSLDNLRVETAISRFVDWTADFEEGNTGACSDLRRSAPWPAFEISSYLRGIRLRLCHFFPQKLPESDAFGRAKAIWRVGELRVQGCGPARPVIADHLWEAGLEKVAKSSRLADASKATIFEEAAEALQSRDYLLSAEWLTCKAKSLEPGRATAINNLAVYSFEAGSYDQARDWISVARQNQKPEGDPKHRALYLTTAARAAREDGWFTTASRRADSLVRLYLGELPAPFNDDHAEALSLLRRSLALPGGLPKDVAELDCSPEDQESTSLGGLSKFVAPDGEGERIGRGEFFGSLAEGLLQRALTRSEIGEFDGAHCDAELAIRLGNALESPEVVAKALYRLASIYRRRGEAAIGLEILLGLRPDSDDPSAVYPLPLIVALTKTYLALDRLDEAEQAFSKMDAAGQVYVEANRLREPLVSRAKTLEASLKLALGEYEECLDLVRNGKEAFRHYNLPDWRTVELSVVEAQCWLGSGAEWAAAQSLTSACRELRGTRQDDEERGASSFAVGLANAIQAWESRTGRQLYSAESCRAPG